MYLSFFQYRFEAWCKFYRFELTNQLSNNTGYTLLLIEIPVKMVNYVKLLEKKHGQRKLQLINIVHRHIK